MNEYLIEYYCKLEERIAQLERDSIKVGDVIKTESHIHEDVWQVNELHITDRRGELQ